MQSDDKIRVYLCFIGILIVLIYNPKANRALKIRDNEGNLFSEIESHSLGFCRSWGHIERWRNRMAKYLNVQYYETVVMKKKIPDDYIYWKLWLFVHVPSLFQIFTNFPLPSLRSAKIWVPEAVTGPFHTRLLWNQCLFECSFNLEFEHALTDGEDDFP